MALGRIVRDVAIGLAATVGFMGIVWLGGRASRGKDEATSPAPQVAPVALPAAGPEPEPAPWEISVLTMLREMADLDHLARRPAAPFVAGQASSYDRRSKATSDPEGWFANDDFVTETSSNLVRVEPAPAPESGKRYVLLDVAGPGAVVRIWTATPNGTLRIYIDGDPKPAIEVAMAALLSGGAAPFAPPFAHVAARGYNLYFPFPYRSRCLITVDSITGADPFTGRPLAKLYYQIGYRTYAASAARDVRPYSLAETARASGAVGRVGALLRDGLPPAGERPGAKVVEVTGATTTLDAPRGGGRIAELRLSTSERAIDKLRATTLAIEIDGDTTVSAPLVDFFGGGPEVTPYRSLPMSVEADGTLVCRFPMPFRARAVVRLAGPGAAGVRGRAVVEPAAFDDGTLLFHARWIPRQVLRTRPLQDWHLLTVDGTGHQVGTALGIENPPGAAWWGEGDEKIYVDGAPFPSLFGTGTEDYFGYAWSTPDTFAHAYHAQTLAPASGFGGRYAMNRFLIVDPVPFTRALRFDLEIWHWTDTAIAADAVLYWYARLGARTDLPPSGRG